MTKGIVFNYTLAVASIAALVVSMFALATPASAFWGGGSSTDNSVSISVSNTNTSVTSDTDAKANTGKNYAGGSYGGDAGDAGDGGDAEYNTSGTNEGGAGGNGGAGGSASVGGFVGTGNADAYAGSINVVNATDIEVEQADCGCVPSHHGWGRSSTDNQVDIGVYNTNTSVNSDTDAYANSGKNKAKGSYGGDGGEGGEGGDADDNSSGRSHHWFWGWGGSSSSNTGGNGGNGGNGGAGGAGGEIYTGDADADAGSLNEVNITNVLVRRS